MGSPGRISPSKKQKRSRDSAMCSRRYCWQILVWFSGSGTMVVPSPRVICHAFQVWSVKLVSDLMTCHTPDSGSSTRTRMSWLFVSIAPVRNTVRLATSIVAAMVMSLARYGCPTWSPTRGCRTVVVIEYPSLVVAGFFSMVMCDTRVKRLLIYARRRATGRFQHYREATHQRSGGARPVVLGAAEVRQPVQPIHHEVAMHCRCGVGQRTGPAPLTTAFGGSSCIALSPPSWPCSANFSGSATARPSTRRPSSGRPAASQSARRPGGGR